MARRTRRSPIFARRRRSRTRRVAAWLPAALLVVVALGLGIARVYDNDQPSASADPGPVHVHALGLDPASRSLFIATHTGLFSLLPDAERADRVGQRHQDTMGFTVVGPDHFLGSGHPDLRDDPAPLLGLIESRDAGETWKSISLLGEADFHVLRVRDRRVVGYDATSVRVLRSGDRGRTWTAGRPPEPLYDLVVDPISADVMLAAGQSRLLVSRDGGRTWNRGARRTGLLAWPRRDRLYLVDPDGRTWLSRNGGSRWRALGHIGGLPAALLAVDVNVLYAATHEGVIRESTDGGATWTIRSEP